MTIPITRNKQRTLCGINIGCINYENQTEYRQYGGFIRSACYLPIGGFRVGAAILYDIFAYKTALFDVSSMIKPLQAQESAIIVYNKFPLNIIDQLCIR